MPETYKREPSPLSNLIRTGQLVRMRCGFCRRTLHYRAEDLIQLYGDVDVDSLLGRLRCEAGADHGTLDVRAVFVTGAEAVGLKVRRLVSIRIRREPVWREE